MTLSKDDLLAKLAQIQEQAQLTLDELPARLAKDRLRLIIGLTKYLATAADMEREPAGTGLESPSKPHPRP